MNIEVTPLMNNEEVLPLHRFHAIIHPRGVIMKKYLVLFVCLMILLFCCSCQSQGVTIHDGALMPDGSIQYRQFNISNKKELEFKNEVGNVWFDEKDVACVYEKYSEDSGYHLILEFTVDATAELSEITKENIGKEMSLFADGEKVFSAMIVAEITNGKIAIIGKASDYRQLMSLTEKITGYKNKKYKFLGF